MNKNTIDIYDALQEIAWHFGSHGINGECCGDLSFVDFMALKKICDNKVITIQGVGFALNFTKSGATRIINRLESKGYVARKNSPADGRVCCVTATKKGTETISSITANYTSYLEQIFESIDSIDVEQIDKVLKALLSAINRNKPFNSDSVDVVGGECM